MVTSDPNSPNDVIFKGAIRGANLFHSFQEFNVAAGRKAYFYSPNSAIQNIIARVTGSNRSEILGFIGTYGNSNPNLFLINPNGIIFGTNASLGVGGSFVASTASSVNLADGTQFSATAHPTTPLLTVSVPIGLQFGETAGGILVQGSSLAVQPGKTLGLVGGDVTVEGGDLATREGRIELGSVAETGLVSLKSIDKDWALGYEAMQNFKDIQLSQQAVVNASGEGGGDIQVQGRRITFTDDARIFADTLGSQKGGGISIYASELIVQDGSQVSASTSGAGSGGTLTVTASDSVKLSGIAPFGESSSGLFARAYDSGAAGKLRIKTGQLTVQDGAIVSASTSGSGQGGTLTVTASDFVKLSGTSPGNESPTGLLAQTQGTGPAGNLTIDTGKLIVRDGAVVTAGTGIDGQGKGGTLTVTASDSVELSGTSAGGRDASGLFTRTRDSGAAGNLTIDTGKLIVRDGAVVTVGSLGSGSGDAGNLEVRTRSILLDHQGAIVAETASGKGGNITLQAQELLLMTRNSRITATAGTAQAGGDGGNITLDTDFLVALENSDITANAFEGRGGNVQINTQGIFGTEFHEAETSESDITASSDLGSEFSGTVEINTQDVDPNRGLVNLPTQPIETEVVQACTPGGSAQQSEFIITGRGGLPPNPTDFLNTDAVWIDLDSTTQQVENHLRFEEATQPTNSTAQPRVEATGWTLNDKGEVVLIASAPTATPHSSGLTPANCHAPQNPS